MPFLMLFRRTDLQEAAPGPDSVLVTSWVLGGLGAAAVGARFYLRLGIQKRNLICGDYIIFMALVAGIATNIMNTLLAHLGALDRDVMMTLAGYRGDPRNIPTIIKIFWGSHFPLWSTFYLCKAALMVAYYNLFVTLVNKLKYFMWATMGYIGLAYVLSILFLICICEPETSWELSLPGASCTISYGQVIFVTTWALHFLGDMLVFSLPWLVIPKIPIKTSIRLSLYITFLLGVVSMVICIIRLVTLLISQVGDNVSMGLMVLWNGLEGNMVVIIACLPSLRPYLGDGEAAKDLSLQSRSRRSWTRASISKPWRKGSKVLVETKDKIQTPPNAHPGLSPTLNVSEENVSEGGRARSNSDEGLVASESAIV